MIDIVLAGLFSPMILFFVLGMVTVFVKSDLKIPSEVSFTMSLFLMASIGLEGGGEAVAAIMVDPAILGVVLLTALFAVLCGPSFAIVTANILKKFAKFKTADAWATGGHYGAVSSATLFVAVALASAEQEANPAALIYVGWLPAMYPFMDSPALLAAIFFGRLSITKEGLSTDISVSKKAILQQTIFGMAVWILLCSLIVGMIAMRFSPIEYDKAMNFFDGIFRGVLCLFLLDMGMAAARRFRELKELGTNLIKGIAIALILPQVWGTVGIFGMYAFNLLFPGVLGWGDAFVFAAIAGGCSFITAPAAMRASLQEANPSIYLPMSVALTFPFNILVGMPLWIWMCRMLWGV